VEVPTTPAPPKSGGSTGLTVRNSGARQDRRSMKSPISSRASALLLLVAAGCVSVTPTLTQAPAAPVAPAPALTTPRIVSAAEDPQEGPCVATSHGCIALNPDVTEATVNETICVSGYTKSVRPATSYTHGVKAKLLGEEEIDASKMSDYELDHIVPLALGGHPRKLSNLMLQRWDGPQGAHMKDILEVRLQKLVCQGKVGLTEAQICIAQDWEACAVKYGSQPRR
jgi:hypothetical protein